VSFVVGERWRPDETDADDCPDDYSVTFAREFRYDTACQDQPLILSDAPGRRRSWCGWVEESASFRIEVCQADSVLRDAREPRGEHRP
jgi:hypothetical protein